MYFLNNKEDYAVINAALDNIQKLSISSISDLINSFNIVVTQDKSIIDDGYYIYTDTHIFLTINSNNTEEIYDFILIHLIGHALIYGVNNKIYVCNNFATTDTEDGKASNLFASKFIQKYDIKNYSNFIKLISPKFDTSYDIEENCDF